MLGTDAHDVVLGPRQHHNWLSVGVCDGGQSDSALGRERSSACASQSLEPRVGDQRRSPTQRGRLHCIGRHCVFGSLWPLSALPVLWASRSSPLQRGRLQSTTAHGYFSSPSPHCLRRHVSRRRSWSAALPVHGLCVLWSARDRQTDRQAGR